MDADGVHALLRHVRARGVPGVPAPGEFIPGVVPAYPMPDWVWDARVLDDTAGWLRVFHDATLDFPREHGEVICHNDYAPYNIVFRDGRLIGVIDYETAAPGARAWDLAYLAYRLVPLAASDNPDLPAQPDAEARLARLCAAYGGVEPADVLALIPPRLDELAEWTAARGGEVAADAALYRADAAHLRAAR